MRFMIILPCNQRSEAVRAHLFRDSECFLPPRIFCPKPAHVNRAPTFTDELVQSGKPASLHSPFDFL
ncbi:hypothetical protein MESS4_680014 [Mesorhizobium sp. STM 4661]|nr:hypothetical protein MESS4_680014 [Mesorhizobium sp. STM 4661]